VTIAEGGLANAASLAAGCGDLWVGVAPPKVVCIPYAFGGARSLVDDVRRMRETDVLLSTHGEALLHGFFLHAGAAVVEVRSHKFRDLGAWSDIYADAFADDGSVHHYTLLLDDRAALGYEEVRPARIPSLPLRLPTFAPFLPVACFCSVRRTALTSQHGTSGSSRSSAPPPPWRAPYAASSPPTHPPRVNPTANCPSAARFRLRPNYSLTPGRFRLFPTRRPDARRG
jgi:hypothetical protein